MDKRLTPEMVAALRLVLEYGWLAKWDVRMEPFADYLSACGMIADRGWGYAWVITQAGRDTIAAFDAEGKR